MHALGGYTGADNRPPPWEANMDDRTQKLLLTALSVGLSALLSRPFTKMISEAIPQRRGVRDDAAEAVLKGATRAVAVIVASAVVRWLAGRRG